MIVMDCCAAVEMVNHADFGQALDLLVLPDEEIVAPTWFRAEVRNVYWKYVHAGLLSEEDASERVGLAESLITRFISVKEYLDEVFVEAVRHDHSFYDMLYLCITRRNAATLFTLDKKLIDACVQAKVNCIDVVSLRSRDSTSSL